MRNRLAAWLAGVVLALGVLGVPRQARAVEYEVFVDIEDNDDLLDLYRADLVSEDTFNTLTELLRRGTNLETADREALYSLPNLTYTEVDLILAYREEAGRVGDPAGLVVAGALSRRKLAAIAPFLIMHRPGAKALTADGFVRYEVVYAPGDRVAPPMFLQGRVNTLQHLTLGFAVGLERARVRNVAYDPVRDTLSAQGPRPVPRFRKYFAQWDNARWGVIAGTYRIGFGQRLVFDSTDRYTPNGFLLDHTVQRSYDLTRECSETAGEFDGLQCDYNRRIAPDYIFRDGQLGVAAGAKRLELPKGHLQAYGWFSLQPRSIYQYKVRDLSRCPDAQGQRDNVSGTDDCSSPQVLHRGSQALSPQSAFRNETLPNIYNDALGGGNLTYFYDRRTHVGATGYGAKPIWRVPGAELDFQDWDRTPYGGAFGAVGVDTAWGYRFADVFTELARSFDNMDTQSERGGGGFAGLVRSVFSFDEHELEISARYYQTDYANPFAGPIAAPDVYDGLRARDEAGGRVRYSAHLLDRVDLRAFLDVWATLDPELLGSANPKGRVYVRTDVQAHKRIRPGLWLEYQRRDLRRDDRTVCLIADVLDAPVQVCRRQRISLTARSRFDLHRRVRMTVQYRHDFQDGLYEGASRSATIDTGGDALDLEDIDLDPSIFDPGDVGSVDFINLPRQDITAFMALTANPVDDLRIHMRVRWQWDDITRGAPPADPDLEIPLGTFVPIGDGNDNLPNGGREHSFYGYISASYKIRSWAVPRLRYGARVYVDKRRTTLTRRNPEHWLRFEFTSRF